jgi:hypothetical protein
MVEDGAGEEATSARTSVGEGAIASWSRRSEVSEMMFMQDQTRTSRLSTIKKVGADVILQLGI